MWGANYKNGSINKKKLALPFYVFLNKQQFILVIVSMKKRVNYVILDYQTNDYGYIVPKFIPMCCLIL